MDISFDYTLLAWLRRGNRRKKILVYLSKQKEPATPTQIKKNINSHLAKVSTSLSELRKKDLVQVLNPQDPYERLYLITKKGKKVVKKLKH